MPYLQEMIHKLENGPWIRPLRIALAVLAVVGLIVGYNWLCFRNFNSQEAMDSAQLARNLSEGRGYITQFVRPISMYLLKERARASPSDQGNDPTRIKGNHPDLANPPVYPCLLAAAMKVLPMKWQIDLNKPFFGKDGRFYRYQPELLIALINELVFLAMIVATFLLARRLFDPGVAWLSGLLLLGSELLWRFSVSGLSTNLLLLIFLCLIWCVVLLEAEVREPSGKPGRALILAGLTGITLGIGMLTRYSFGWLIIPVLVYFMLFGGTRKAVLCLLTLAAFLLVATPWIYRNLRLCGLPFGTATFAFIDASFFSGNNLSRSLQPDFAAAFPPNGRLILTIILSKLFSGLRLIIGSDIPKLGGSWLSALFLTGLLLGFRNLAIRRLRYFVMMCLGMLCLVQALGRTQLSQDTSEINSENLLVLVVPLVFVYGVSLFYMMLDQMNLLFQGLRAIVVGAFGAIMLLPLLMAFLPPRPGPVNFPPYNPYAVQHVCRGIRTSETVMSDMPWAVAWYGQRQCIWLTPDAADTFFAISDFIKPVSALLLTPLTLNAPFATEWIKSRKNSWNQFVLESVLRHGFPTSFPLRESLPGLLPDFLFLTDRRRWDEKNGAMIPAED